MSSHKSKIKIVAVVALVVAVVVLVLVAFSSVLRARNSNAGTDKSIQEAAIETTTEAGPKAGCVIFLHSGGFVIEKNEFHEQFGKAMADSLNYDYMVPDYPINQTYKTTIEFMENIYKEAMDTYDNVLMVGCSAGANLAVGTMISYGEEYGMPSGLILMSPWLDTAMKNEEIQCVSEFDKEFFDSLVEWGSQYHGGETENALASPVNASKDQLKGFPKTVMIVGTEDILRYDAKNFYESLTEAGVDVVYWDAEGKNHGEVFAEYASTYVMPEIMTRAMGELTQ